MKKGTIALMFLMVGGGGFFLTSGPVEGLRFLFLLIGLTGLSWFMTPKAKKAKKQSRG